VHARRPGAQRPINLPGCRETIHVNRERWRHLPTHQGASELHFRLSDALVRVGREPTVWWHGTSTPTLIVGAAQRLTGGGGGDVIARVQRGAGGTAVLATADVLAHDVFLPMEHPLVLRDVVESYRWLGETWRDALRELGVEARVVSIAEARGDVPPEGLRDAIKAACFGSLSPYEVVVGRRKLVGLAQVRRTRGVLWQVGIHRQFDAERLAALVARERTEDVATELRLRSLGLAEVLPGEVDDEEIRGAFARALRQRYGVELAPGRWTEEELRYAGAEGDGSLMS
jgi:lipoate-protein ligase A